MAVGEKSRNGDRYDPAVTEHDQDLLGGLAPFVGEQHRSTIGVLVSVMRTGRQLESWLSATLTAERYVANEKYSAFAVAQTSPGLVQFTRLSLGVDYAF